MLIIGKCYPQCNCDSLIYAVPVENRNYLYHLYFQNDFDSAMTELYYGEIRLIANDTTKHIKFDETIIF